MKLKHVATMAAALALGAPAYASAAGPPAPVDPQNWTFQDNFTWTDYKPLPGTDYSDPDDRSRRSRSGRSRSSSPTSRTRRSTSRSRAGSDDLRQPDDRGA